MIHTGFPSLPPELSVRGLAAAACCLILAAGDLAAQTIPGGRTFIEAVGSVAGSSSAPDDPFVFLDVATTVRVAEGLDILVRPYVRRLPGGDWDGLLYQAQIRYLPAPGVRVEAGIITSPLGLGTLELRPDLNATVGYPFYYFAPLPRFDQYDDRMQLLAGGYPLGAVVSWSGSWLDARAGVTDGTPARYRKIFGAGPPAMPQVVAGGGITPAPGLRIGGGLATGSYRRASDAGYGTEAGHAWSRRDADALVLNLEAEYAVRHTRLSGEWVRNRFETDGVPAIARGFYVQAVQTLTPRIFAAVRLTHASSPVALPPGPARWDRSVGELTGGYRITPELTLRASYQAAQPFGAAAWTHAMLGSIVWAKRWF